MRHVAARQGLPWGLFHDSDTSYLPATSESELTVEFHTIFDVAVMNTCVQEFTKLSDWSPQRPNSV